MNSQNHHMMGSVDAWFYEALGGINVDPDHPGYRHIRIEPQVMRDLTSVSATVGTRARQGNILLDATSRESSLCRWMCPSTAPRPFPFPRIPR